ncbi:hypothetical protein AB0C21_08020 [Spirillospora sp. NPDC049024]
MTSWSDVVYVAFVIDIFSRAVVGGAAATTKGIRLVLDALDMALWRRDGAERPVRPAWSMTAMPGPCTPLSGSPRTWSTLGSTPDRYRWRCTEQRVDGFGGRALQHQADQTWWAVEELSRHGIEIATSTGDLVATPAVTRRFDLTVE